MEKAKEDLLEDVIRLTKRGKKTETVIASILARFDPLGSVILESFTSVS
jgi:hypothetical protein